MAITIQTKRFRKSRLKAGYSLLEILIVLAIIALIVALVGPRLIGQLDKSKVTAAHVQIKSLKSALDTMHLDIGRYPTQQEGLTLLAHSSGDASANWSGPYLSGDLPKDPWGETTFTFPLRLIMPNRRSARSVQTGNLAGQAMLLISPSKALLRRAGRAAVSKAGYSLIEIMVVIAIMAVASAIAVPRAASALDQVISHTVFFEFQRQVSSLRAEAFRNERSVALVEVGQTPAGSDVVPVQTATISLRSGWTYKMSAPLLIDAGSSCSISDVDLFNSGRKIMHLESRGHDCRFIRTV